MALSYYSLLRHNKAFAYYTISNLITQFGSWLNFIATLSLITNLLSQNYLPKDDIPHDDDQATSYTPLALLLFLRMLPALLVSPTIGGPCADAYDKRKIMILLDFSAGFFVGVIFPLAQALKSPALLYIAVFGLASLDAIYNPAKNAIIPFMLSTDEEVNKATSMLAISWSIMAAVGAAVGGLVTDWGGETTCFRVDAVTFIVSGLLLICMGPNWRKGGAGNSAKLDLGNRALDSSSTESEAAQKEISTSASAWRKVTAGVRYLRQSKTGRNVAPLVFLKAAGCIMWGSADLLNVAFAGGDDRRMGWIFAAVGVGCLLGPNVSDALVKRKASDGAIPLKTLLRLCVIGMGLVTFGFLGFFFSKNLANVLFFTAFRAAGSSMVWVYSSVMLQLMTHKNILGRILSIEFATAIFAEGVSSFVAAFLLDKAGFKETTVCLIIFVAGFALVLCPLSFYYASRWGAVAEGADSESDVEDDSDAEYDKLTSLVGGDNGGNRTVL